PERGPAAQQAPEREPRALASRGRVAESPALPCTERRESEEAAAQTQREGDRNGPDEDGAGAAELARQLTQVGRGGRQRVHDRPRGELAQRDGRQPDEEAPHETLSV